jgi:hypothetical protein
VFGDEPTWAGTLSVEPLELVVAAEPIAAEPSDSRGVL